MSSSDTRPVVLAVKHAHGAEAALFHAVQEALRTGSALRILHVAHPYPVPGEGPVVGGGLIGPSPGMLEQLAERATAGRGRAVDITCEVVRGQVTPTLVSHTADARLVVLVGQSRPEWSRLATGSVRHSVAAQSPVPVVCVPPGWYPPRHRREVVVAGVEDAHHLGDPARCALALGAARGMRVRLVHAWWFTEPLDDVGLAPETVEAWSHVAERSMQTALTQVLAEDFAEHPALDVSVVATHRRPVDALLEESQVASMLVLGRRDARVPFGSPLGPVVRALLQRAPGPVMVVDTMPAPVADVGGREPDLVVEAPRAAHEV